MNIYFALCGNKYSEVLSLSFASERGVTLVHRSNVRKLHERFNRIFVIILALVLRYLVLPFIGGNFVVLAPHAAGNYRWLIGVLNPNQCVLVDDGITFEYWSEFHEKHILPLYTSSKTVLLLGPRQPNWKAGNRRNLALHRISRRKITEGILASFSKIQCVCGGGEGGGICWIVDDGQFASQDLVQLQDEVRRRFECVNFVTLWHPARTQKGNGPIKIQPAEVSILCSGARRTFVVGKASTTLFNIAAYDRDIQVVSLPSGYFDLDQAARKQGIAIMEFGAHGRV